MHVLFWGCGNMAGALGEGLRRARRDWRFTCWTPTGTQARALAGKIGGAFLDTEKIPSDVTAVVLGFKPQNLAEAGPALATRLPAGCLVVSLLAAITRERLTTVFPGHPTLRLMPNLAIATGDGVVLWEGDAAGGWREALGTMGLALETKPALMDVYTLMGASSPAFLYRWLQEAGEFAQARGGSADEAVALMTQAFRAALKETTPHAALAGKIEAVASKGGVTQAVLDRWREVGPKHMVEGLAAGLQRLDELKAR